MSTRCGFVAILGAPNAGKSTLLNRLTGAKLSIVSPKAQTTRARVLGIVMQGESQVLLLDTPGIFAPKRRLDRAMVAAAWGGARDADLLLFLVDAVAGTTPQVRAIAAELAKSERPAWLVLNKVDAVAPAALLPLTAALNELSRFAETYMVSASTGDGVAALQQALAAAMPEGPYLYPPDDLTDLPDRLLAAEIVREQVFLQTHDEVPYGATVETESFTERRDGSVRIEATIYVARPGHKAILIGAGGARIRDIGARARAQLIALLERPVHLFLNVKERPGWDAETARLRAIGLPDAPAVSDEPEWLAWLRELQAIAQTGLAYTRDPYDRERFEALQALAARIAARHGDAPVAVLQGLFAGQTGYATPKIDVRGACFDGDGRLLLVREVQDDGRWTLPGGWADVNLTPAENVVKEVREESGFLARVVKCAGVWDRTRQGHTPAFFSCLKLFFVCELVGGSAEESLETTDAAFFTEAELPQDLSTGRVLPHQLRRMFAHWRDRTLPTEFE